MNGLVRIHEGSTDLYVPENHSSGGPGKINGQVFFNEQMAFNRDVSVMFLRAIGEKMTVCDAMSASGARAVRIANEVSDCDVTSNDINSDAFSLIKKNIKLNKLDNCAASNRNLHSLLAENNFDYVDIDPFGSPIPFLHSAIIGCRRNGILAITATDTAPLAGAHAQKCVRRYEARPLRGPMCHEMGLRLLMGSIARQLSKFDRGMVPLLSFSADHYFRVYLRVTEGAGNADKTLDKLVFVSYDQKTLERSFSPKSDSEHKYGPFWGGNLFDKKLIEKMGSDGMEATGKCEKYLELWRNEIDDVPLVYEISEISSFTKKSTPKFDAFVDYMNSIGPTSKTHLSPTSFKTRLSLEEIVSAYENTSGKP